MNSCSMREYVNLDNKLSCEEWIFSGREFYCCYTYWIHAFLIYAEIWPTVYKRQPFCESSLDQGGRESVKLQPHASSVLCLFQFSELKCFPHSPTPCIPSSISLHLLGPTCLSLICLPCTISHFSLPRWIVYLHTTPPPPSIALAPFFSSRSLLHLSSSPLHIHHSLCPFSPSSHSDVSRINFLILLIQQIKFYPPAPSLLISILWKKEKKSTDLNRQINHQVIASSFPRSRLPADEWTRSLFSFL